MTGQRLIRDFLETFQRLTKTDKRLTRDQQETDKRLELERSTETSVFIQTERANTIQGDKKTHLRQYSKANSFWGKPYSS